MPVLSAATRLGDAGADRSEHTNAVRPTLILDCMFDGGAVSWEATKTTGEHRLLALRLIGAALIAATVFRPIPSHAADLSAALAKQMNAKPSDFVLNLPPRSGCLPGSIFTEDLRLPLERTRVNDPALDTGPPFSLDADLGSAASGDVGGTFAPIFGFLLSHNSSGTMTVHAENAHVIEMLGGDLKKRLLASAAAHSAADHGTDPFIVFRAYEGKVSFVLGRKQGTSANAWAKVQADAAQLHAGGELTSDNAVIFTLPEPIIFAFEVMKATYVATHLGAAANEVVLSKVTASQFKR